MRNLGKAERLRDALKRIAREAERREQERAAGLLGERWMREPSNGPSAARKERLRDAKYCIAREVEQPAFATGDGLSR